jgi:Predicted glycosyltransferases
MASNVVKLLISIVNYNCASEVKKTLDSFIDKLKDFDVEFIVVDNFFSNSSLDQITKLSKEYGFILLKSENLGFGHAHNLAFSFAKENRQFDFYIISNPDIEIISLDGLKSYMGTESIIAPSIVTINGVLQNPYVAYRSWVGLRLWYIHHRYSSYLFWAVASMYNKICNRYVRCFVRKQIYAPHGAFIILSRAACAKFSELFDSSVFLFGEEFVFAEKCYRNSIPIFYDREIQVFHVHEVSTGKIDADKQQQLRHISFLSYYTNHYRTRSN